MHTVLNDVTLCGKLTHYVYCRVCCHLQVIQVGYIYVIFVLGFRAVCRSAEWRTEGLLFHSGLSVCPLNAKVHYNIAKNAGDAGNRTLAVFEYRQALRSVT